MSSGTPLGRVRGLGATHTGSHHWLAQRTTALANAALVTWLLVSLLRLDLGSFAEVRSWAGEPMVALPLVLAIVTIFWHLRLGLQVLIEDYAHGHTARIIALVALNFYVFAGAAYGIFAVARIAFAGTMGA